MDKAFERAGEASASRFRCTFTLSSPTSEATKAVLSSGASGRAAGRTSSTVGDWKSLYEEM